MKVTVRDKDYLVDSEFTGHEWRLIKEVSGVRVLEYEAAVLAGDYDVLVAIAMIALRRAGQFVSAAELLDEPSGVITIDWHDGGDVDPTAPDGETPSGEESSKATGDATGAPSSPGSTG